MIFKQKVGICNVLNLEKYKRGVEHSYVNMNCFLYILEDIYSYSLECPHLLTHLNFQTTDTFSFFRVKQLKKKNMKAIHFNNTAWDSKCCWAGRSHIHLTSFCHTHLVQKKKLTAKRGISPLSFACQLQQFELLEEYDREDRLDTEDRTSLPNLMLF